MTLEEMQEKLLQMEEKYKVQEEELKQYKTQKDEDTQRIKELQEYNQKLFMRVTTEKEQVQVEDEIPDCVDKATWDVLDEKLREELKELFTIE